LLFLSNGLREFIFRYQTPKADCADHAAAFLDDDCLPGPRYIELCLHTINTDSFNGLLGVKGHFMEEDRTGIFYYGPVDKSNAIAQV
jgi:hypothetical protein